MLEPGDQIDLWVVEKALGSGGMGSVYRCRNKSTSRISAAVKVLDSNLSRFPEAEARFVREAEILFGLEHPNIVKVRNIRTDFQPPYLEMEFVEGRSLDALLAHGRMDVEQAFPMMVQIAAALGYLHSRGIRHRDIKPANVLVQPDGRVKLVDFGLAMEADASRLTQTGLAFGTVSYSPPEWISPEALDPAKWDVYAAGVVFWEMITGRVAFRSTGGGNARQQAAQVIFAKQGHAPLDPGDLAPDELRAVIRDATDSDASRRIPNGEELYRRLIAIDPELAIPTPRPAFEAALVPVPAARPTPELPERVVPSALVRAPTPPTAPRPVQRPAVGRPVRTAALIGIAAIAAIGAAGLAVRGGAPSARPVAVRAAGLAEETPVTMWADGHPAASTRGGESTFSLEPGPVELTWAVGERCDQGCPGTACPVWCGVGSARVVFDGASDRIDLPVSPPIPRDVSIRLPPSPAGAPATATLAGRRATIDGNRAVVTGVLPGSYPLEIEIGACPSDARGCAVGGTCPAGCTSFAGAATVPWGTGEVELPPPLPLTAARAAAPEPPPRPPAEAKPARAGNLVTVGQIASWLAADAEWQPERVGIPGYLDGWVAAEPPPGSDRAAPATGLTWAAAKAYCAGRGGLASVDVAPRAWTSGPTMEFRVGADGEALFRASEQTGPTQTRKPSHSAGFRCAK